MKHFFQNIAHMKRKEMSNRAIAEALSLSRNTVNRYVSLMESSGMGYLDIENMDVSRIEKEFDLATGPKKQDNIIIPNYEALTAELSKPGVTMQLLWEEYVTECRLSNKTWYRITQFKKYFKEHLEATGFTDIIHHKAGEKIEVDWSGVKPSWKDPITKEIVSAQLFVAVLPFSQYIFAQATIDMTMPNWIDAHINMFEFFKGVSRILVPDNLKTGVTKNSKNEVILNQTYKEMADHYGLVVIPTRVRSPQDKASVEGAVKEAQRQIVARIRNYQFFSIEEVNIQIIRELETLNNRPFQKKEGSRSIVFHNIEKHCLNPLPKKPYELAEWRQAKVQNNSHISVKKHYYSVPYDYIGKTVKLKISNNYLQVYYEGDEICVHRMVEDQLNKCSTITSHMPPMSNAHTEWNKDRYLNWAKQKGPFTYKVVLKQFDSTNIEQQQYKMVHSIIKLSDKFTNERLESACQLALKHLERPSYKNLKGILENNQGVIEELTEVKPKEVKSRFLRGGSYYE